MRGRFGALTTAAKPARNRPPSRRVAAALGRLAMMKKLVAAMAVLAGLSTAALAQQDYPNRIIKIMQGFPPGGNVDIIARILGHEMEKSLGQSIVVEAKPGLAGALAAETIARSDPDGYTLLVLPSAHPAYARAVEEREIQGGGRLHLDFGRELLSVHDLREGGLALPDAQAVDRRGARQARRTEIRLGRRRLDPAHHGRADGRRDQDQVSCTFPIAARRRPSPACCRATSTSSPPPPGRSARA